MEKPTITIGIPSYNQQEYLSEAIDSAIHQTRPCEIIVVDDGSTDNSLEIAQNYGNKVKVISQVNKGLASARNTIIMNMQGDYLLPLDADDKLMPNAVLKILEKIRETDADIVAPSFKTFGTSNQEIILMEHPMVWDFLEGNPLGYFSAIRKSKLLEIGGYSPRMTWGWEDYHLWIDLLNRGAKLVTIKDILVLYRTKENSMWT
jgi:glycosyltransferase involved in cell wall biosynthesis